MSPLHYSSYATQAAGKIVTVVKFKLKYYGATECIKYGLMRKSGSDKKLKLLSRNVQCSF